MLAESDEDGTSDGRVYCSSIATSWACSNIGAWPGGGPSSSRRRRSYLKTLFPQGAAVTPLFR
eukprot:1045396-Pyramimonas_sp.AAC.1